MVGKNRWTLGVGLASLVVVLFTLGGAGFTIGGPTATDTPCYAFLLDGDVWLNCARDRQRVTQGGDVADFAADSSGRALAVERYKSTRQSVDGRVYFQPSHTSIELLSPMSGEVLASSKAKPYEQLVSSCGTILEISQDPWIGDRPGLTRDLLQDKWLAFSPYRDFRCSSNSDKIMGRTSPDRLALMFGTPPRELAEPKSPPLLYDISTAGNFVAYWADFTLCVMEGGGAPKCLPGVDASDRISVSDSGEVLLATGTDGGCYYKDEWHVSKKPRPDYEGEDQCIGVAAWKPGRPTIEVVAPLARDPQWLTQKAASALMEWGRRQQRVKQR